MKTSISVLRARLVRPLGPGDCATWDTLGQRLRVLRDHAWRALNAALQATYDRGRVPEGPPGDTLAWRAAKAVMGQCHAPMGMAAAFSRAASKLYATHRAAVRRGERTLPTYRHGAPIMIRADGWSLEEVDGDVVLSVKLHGGRTPWTRIVIAPPAKGRKRRRLTEAAWWYAGVRRILAGGGRDAKIAKDRRSGAWEVLLSHETMIGEVVPGAVLGVHMGMTVPVEVATPDGTRMTKIGTARECWAFRAQMRERKRRLGQAARGARGSAGVGGGRGWKRRHRAIDRLDGAEARWVGTKCRQWAAQVCKLGRRWKCGTLAVGVYAPGSGGPVREAQETDRDERGVENIVLFWQPARLREALAQAAARNGLEVVEVPEAHRSRTCSRCGHEDVESRVSRAMFRCTACGATMDAEENAAINVARGASGEVVGPPAPSDGEAPRAATKTGKGGARKRTRKAASGAARRPAR